MKQHTKTFFPSTKHVDLKKVTFSNYSNLSNPLLWGIVKFDYLMCQDEMLQNCRDARPEKLIKQVLSVQKTGCT